ncbi:MAG: class I SAM-dependent methyltransferase [Gemmatimonadota bacterium]
MKTAEYYDRANYVDDELLRGTGVIGLLAGDQLHPPMVDDPEIWRNSGRWQHGAAESVRRLLRNAGIQPGDLVLDVGCGIGGATRMLTREFGARAIGLNISEEQMRTARKLGNESYIKGSAEEISVRSNSVAAVLSVNMFYHLFAHFASLREMMRITRSRGVLAFDDWVLTDRATEEDRRQLNLHWNPEPVRWITDEELLGTMQAAGYVVEGIDDLSRVGRGVMAEHFGPTFEVQVRPMLVAHDPQHGAAVADHVKQAIDHTIELYREHKLRYLQIVASKP